jgi:hypothetical protein
MRLAARVVYVLDVHRFYDEVTYLMLDEARLCAVASELGVEGFAVKGKNGIVAQLMGHPGGVLRRAHSLTVRPGLGLLVQEAEGLCVNLWRPSELVPSGGDPAVWLEHMERLIPDAADRARTIDRMAYALQNPGVKLNSALVLLGGQGTGKDSALQPFWAAVGAHNVAVVPGMQIGGDFNEYMQKPWLLVTEMPSFRKRSSYEEIKALLTTPPDHIRINLKGVPAFKVPNIANLVVTTNHADAIALAEDDRRFDVIDTVPAARGEEGYFRRYYAWLEAGGSEAVMGWLLRREVTAFDPKVAPPVSAAKATMKREAEAPVVAWARSLWGEDGPLVERKLVTLDELMELARRGVWGASNIPREHRYMAQLQKALLADGWASTGVQIHEGEGRPRVWARNTPGMYAQMGPKALRERLEEDRKRSAGREF